METLETLSAKVEALTAKTRRQTVTLIIALVALAITLKPYLFGYGKVVCDQWQVVDKDGKVRIDAATLANGEAGVSWLDKDGKQRISACTLADGAAGVSWLDKDGKFRIAAVIYPDGTIRLPTKELLD